MSGLGFLGIAYALAWLLVGGYLLFLAKRQKNLETRIDELTRKESSQ